MTYNVFGGTLSLTQSIIACVCSLAVEPQYPQLCIRQSDAVKPPTSPSSQSAELLNPMELSAVLNSLPCSLTFTADDHLTVIQTLVALVSTTTSSSSSSIKHISVCYKAVTSTRQRSQIIEVTVKRFCSGKKLITKNLKACAPLILTQIMNVNFSDF